METKRGHAVSPNDGAQRAAAPLPGVGALIVAPAWSADLEQGTDDLVLSAMRQMISWRPGR